MDEKSSRIAELQRLLNEAMKDRPKVLSDGTPYTLAAVYLRPNGTACLITQETIGEPLKFAQDVGGQAKTGEWDLDEFTQPGEGASKEAEAPEKPEK